MMINLKKGEISMAISAEIKQTLRIFRDFWFEIPIYQRPYVWGKEQILDLLDDLEYAYSRASDREYFLGSLVLRKIANGNDVFPLCEVLDGQQRLTTFLIILAVIRDLVDGNVKSEIQAQIYREDAIIEGIQARTRIMYRRDSANDVVNRILAELDGTLKHGEIEKFKNDRDKSAANIAMAVEIIREYFNTCSDDGNLIWTPDEIVKFITFIDTKSTFAYVSADDEEDAFKIFTVLNNRGIPLTSADILKAENIGVLREDDKARGTRIWEDVENKFKNGNFDGFLQFIRAIYVKEKANSNLLSEFSREIYQKERLKKGMDTINAINEYCEIYEKIIENNGIMDNKYKNLIVIMNTIKSEDWKPPLMYVYKKFQEYFLANGSEKFYKFVVKLEYKFSSDWICGLKPTARRNSMFNILKAIEKTDSMDMILNDDSLFKVDGTKLEEALNKNIYGEDYAKFILLKYEYIIRDHCSVISDYGTISIEHVLPQNPDADSMWRRDFSDEEMDYWTHRLANLILLSRKTNSKLSNLDFVNKKDRYYKCRMDIFQSTKIFIDCVKEWTPTILETRQKNMIEILKNNMSA